MTFVDAFSKYAQAYEVENKTATEIAEKYLRFTSHHGIPQKLIVDKSGKFDNKSLREICNSHDTEFHLISSDHPQSNGIIDKFHCTLIEHIKTLKLTPQFKNDSIPMLVLYSLVAYNNSISDVTKSTPHEIISGHLETDNFLNVKDSLNTQTYVQKHKEYCRKLYDLIHHRLDQNKEKYIAEVNENRKPAPTKQPNEVLRNNTQDNTKVKPSFIPKKTQQKANTETMVLHNPKKPAGEKVRLDQIKKLYPD